LQTVALTGAAGFIGFHVAQALLSRGVRVVGLDRMDSYYEIGLKQARLDLLVQDPGFSFHRLDIAETEALNQAFGGSEFDAFIHLAAQPGVRLSVEQPELYVHSNLVGFSRVLEWCRKSRCPHLIFASSSSVYGSESRMPYQESMAADHPKSFYGATKRCNEIMAHSYADLYGLPVTGLRFFTVYGPWGRPDMAPFKFTRKLLAGEPIDIYNHGNLSRDFTYVDDIVEGILRVAARPAVGDPQFDTANPDSATSQAPYRIYNIGQGKPVQLLRFVEVLEECLGVQAVKNFLPMQPGDVYNTFADSGALQRDFGYQPQVTIEEGVGRFVRWYRHYYQVG